MLLQGLLIVSAALLLYWIIRSIMEVFSALMLSCALGLVAAFLIKLVVIPEGGEGLLVSILVGLVAFTLTFRSAQKSGERRRLEERRNRAKRVWDMQPTPSPRPASKKKVEPIERQLGVEKPDAIITAWQTAADLCSGDKFQIARERCARLLALVREGQIDDFELIETATFVRRQIPELVKETQAVCHSCEPREREASSSELQYQLDQIGMMAFQQLERQSHEAKAKLALRRLHIAERLRAFSGPAS